MKTTWKVNVNYTLLIREISLFCGISVGGVSSYSAESELYVHGRIASHRISRILSIPACSNLSGSIRLFMDTLWIACGRGHNMYHQGT